MKPGIPEECRHIPIAHGNNGKVSICPECQVVHVELSYMSLRFTPEAFRDIAHMLGAAQQRLERATVREPAVAEIADSGRSGLH